MFKNNDTDTVDLLKFTKDELIKYIMDITIEKNKIIKKLKKVENQLQISKEKEIKYKSIFELSSDAILIIEKGNFVECNKAVLKMLEYKTKKEFLNTHPSVLSPEKQPDGRLSFEKAEEMMNLALKKGIHKFEWIHTRSNGENFPVEVWLSAVKYGDKTLINTIWRDLTEKNKKEEIIFKNIKEKETLLKEIHHRVKNNFQIISSLLNLQSEYIDDVAFKNLCIQCKNRIDSMYKIHEMMYGAENLSSISIKKYICNLVDNILKSYSRCLTKFKIYGDNIHLSLDTAIPIGLIINEIITNSVKYAFNENINKNSIYVKINNINNNIFIDIGDNGIGFSTKLFKENSKTLGFQLIYSLISQIDGKIIKLDSIKGTDFKIEIPYKPTE